MRHRTLQTRREEFALPCAHEAGRQAKVAQVDRSKRAHSIFSGQAGGHLAALGPLASRRGDLALELRAHLIAASV